MTDLMIELSKLTGPLDVARAVTDLIEGVKRHTCQDNNGELCSSCRHFISRLKLAARGTGAFSDRQENQWLAHCLGDAWGLAGVLTNDRDRMLVGEVSDAMLAADDGAPMEAKTWESLAIQVSGEGTYVAAPAALAAMLVAVLKNTNTHLNGFHKWMTHLENQADVLWLSAPVRGMVKNATIISRFYDAMYWDADRLPGTVIRAILDEVCKAHSLEAHNDDTAGDPEKARSRADRNAAITFAEDAINDLRRVMGLERYPFNTEKADSDEQV